MLKGLFKKKSSLTGKYMCFQYAYAAGKEALSTGYAGPNLKYTMKGISINNVYLSSD